MKVLQIYKDFYPPVVGGIEGHINVLSKGLMKQGFDVSVLVSNTIERLGKENIDGIQVIKAPEFGRFASAPINLTFPSLLRNLARDADLLHFHLPNPTATASYLLSGINKPVIATYHSDIVRQARLKKLYWPIEKKFLDRVDTIIATSPNYIQTSRVLSKYAFKCKTVPLGIETSRFKLFDSRLKQKIKEKYGDRIVLFIGKFRYYKGLHILIDAMKRVDAKLLVIGEGQMKENLRKQTASIKISDRVKLLGELSDREVRAYLNACSMLVLPSVFRSEAYGLVLLEAMACGKPVISTELGTGTTFINLHNETGLVVPPNDSSSLAQAINYLFEHPEKSRIFGTKGKERVESYFTCEKMVETTIDLYHSKAKIKKYHIINNHSKKYKNCGKNKKIKIMRVVSRLNIGGPAIHVALLLKKINSKRFETKLVTGTISAHEGDMSYLLSNSNGLVQTIPELQREINLKRDFIAFFKIFRAILKEKPNIVHTHMAKAGTIARLAAGLYNLLYKPKIRIVHTFHGHVLEGYFSKTKTGIFRMIERIIAKFTDCIIAISQTQSWELVYKYRIAAPEKINIINLGFNLRPFLNSNKLHGTFRKRIGVVDDTILIGIVGRLVPIKNHYMFLDAAKLFLDCHQNISVKFVVIGDGELKNQLIEYANSIKLQENILFHGWEKNITEVYADLNVLALTSRNEGTPVSIIEAMASGVPIITTGVGGVKDLLGQYESVIELSGKFIICERGILIKKNDSIGLANGFKFILENQNLDRINKARRFVIENYSDKRLVERVEKLYERIAMDPMSKELRLPGNLSTIHGVINKCA